MVALTDKFQKQGAATVTTLAAPGKALAASTITVGSTTNYPTTTGFTVGIRVVDTNGALVAGSYTEWTATVTSGTTLSLTTTPVFGSDRVYAAGSTTQVFVPVSSASYNRMVDGLLVAHNQDGTLIQAAVQSALGIASIPPADWTSLPIVPLLTTSNGQKENSLTFTGVDYTDRLQKGSKLRIPRTSTVPTQSATFVAASSQYANKVSPAGMTFTNNFTIEGWINPASYAIGMIAGRTDATAVNGFYLRMEATGQIILSGNNGAGNVRSATTYQSVPLNKRTHVTATWATGTLLMYLDGALVPSLTATLGTAPTTIALGTDFAIGRGGSYAGQYFNGEVSDFRIWSTVRTVAQIRDNAGKQLIGNEANLVGYWKLNGDFLDSTANANHLTAQAGAVATTVSHAFSPIEYAIVTSTPVFAAGNTTCTVFTGNGVLPNETLGATSYSGQRAPFGFPAERSKWRVSTLLRTTIATTSNATYGAFGAGGYALTTPSGSWKVGQRSGSYFNQNISITLNMHTSALTGLTVAAAHAISPFGTQLLTSAAASMVSSSYIVNDVELLSMATYVMYSIGATTVAGIDGASTLSELFAESNYL